MSPMRSARQMGIVGHGPSLPPPHPESLESVLSHARCILWTADVEGVGEWRAATDPNRAHLRWRPRVINEAAAQAVLPLDIKPGSNYFEAWRDSRHREDDKRMWHTAYSALSQNRPFYQQVFRCFDRNCVEHWMHEHVSISPMGDGLWYAVGTSYDITPYWQATQDISRLRQQLDHALEHQKQSAAVLDVLLESVPLGVALLSRDYRMLRVNRGFCRLNGLSESTITGEPVTRWIDPTLSAVLARGLEHVLATGRAAQDTEIELDQTRQILLVSVFPIALQQDTAVAAGATVQDITHRHEAEGIRIARQAAEAASIAKDRFMAMLSHELRMPLTPVLALTSSLENDERLPADIREDFTVIRRNAQLEARLIDDLLDTTRIARGKLLLTRRHCDMNGIVSHAIEMCDDLFAEKAMTCTTSLAASRAIADVDPVRMQQVIANLLSNALKYTPAGGQISVRTCDWTQEQKPFVRIEVQDNGIGISRDSLSRIFDPFEQALELHDHQRQGGLGLGLAICKWLVEAHEGTICAASPGTGHGSTFTVMIPAAREQRAKAAEPAAAPQTATGIRILLVEDHLDTARVMAKLLRQLKYVPTTATCVREAIDLLSREPFEIIISDLGLPDGSGIDVLHQSGTTIPAIVLTGFGSDEDVNQTRAAGFVEHLTKPVTLAQLQSAIARHLPEQHKRLA